MSHHVKYLHDSGAKRKRQYESNDYAQSTTRKSRKLSAESSPTPETGSLEDNPSKTTSKHTKKERKQNRSTRIHSLRKQLARGTLPSTIQQEKERELAALLHEQTKTVSKKQVKKTLEKYHYVRFLERRKAEKKLKQLRKQQEVQGESAELSNMIHEMEVNRNYAIYAPLGEKYISIFVSGTEGQSTDTNSNIGKRPPKPATWYTVETAMLGGEARLEALRDGAGVTLVERESDDEKPSQKHKKQMAESKKSHVDHEVARKQDRANRKVSFQVEEEPEPSSDGDDIDGGFFER